MAVTKNTMDSWIYRCDTGIIFIKNVKTLQDTSRYLTAEIFLWDDTNANKQATFDFNS